MTAARFIDEVSLAAGAVAVRILVGAARFEGVIGGPGAAALLCGGMLLALLENVVHSARAIERRPPP